MMLRARIFITVILVFCCFSTITAQINLGERALGAIGKGLKAMTFSDADAANLSIQAVAKMDTDNKIAGPKDPLTLRLNKVFGKHMAENGLKLNYKVYLNNDVNAFATADGSIRVFAGLMKIMDDNELLAVIGHEIGHVANSDSRDAMKAAYTKSAITDAVASQSEKIAALSDGQLGQLASSLIDSKHSRKQETEADTFSYDFMKKHGYNVNAVASAFEILAKMSTSNDAGFLEKMMASHPDPADRAAIAKQRATDDGLYKPYVKISKSTVKKVTRKK